MASVIRNVGYFPHFSLPLYAPVPAKVREALYKVWHLHYFELYETNDESLSLEEALDGLLETLYSAAVTPQAFETHLFYFGVALAQAALRTIEVEQGQCLTEAAGVVAEVLKALPGVVQVACPESLAQPDFGRQSLDEAALVIAGLTTRGAANRLGMMREMMLCCLEGEAIVVGSRGRRDILNWMLVEVWPAAWNDNTPRYTYDRTMAWPPPSPAVDRGHSSGEEWLRSLDWSSAYNNVYSDLFGDWYADRWKWPEMAWAVRRGLPLLLEFARNPSPGRVAALDVPKDSGGCRPAVVLPPCDRLTYQAAVDASSVELVGSLHNWAYGWRLVRGNPSRGFYAQNRFEWRSYLNELTRLGRSGNGLRITDVSDFFRSVPVESLVTAITQRARPEAAALIAKMLAGWTTPDRYGLPQRALASSVLGNAYLETVDRGVSVWCASRNATPVRWMDDLWIFAEESLLDEAGLHVDRLLLDLSLTSNEAKSMSLSPAQAGEHIRQVLAAGASYDDTLSMPRQSQMLEFVDLEPSFATRAIVRYLAKWAREESDIDAAYILLKHTEQWPYAADCLARLASAFGLGDTALSSWYCTKARDVWKSDWAVGRFLEAFNEKSEAVTDLALKWASTEAPFAWAAPAAGWLAQFRVNGAVEALRKGAQTTHDPLTSRAIALALLELGEEVSTVREILGAFPETMLLLRLLEERGSSFVINADAIVHPPVRSRRRAA